MCNSWFSTPALQTSRNPPPAPLPGEGSKAVSDVVCLQKMLTLLIQNAWRAGNNVYFAFFQVLCNQANFFRIESLMRPFSPPPDTASSAETARHLKAARDKLASSAGGKISYSYELLMLYARNQLHMVLGIPVLAIILALSALMWAPPLRIAIWLMGVFLAQGVLLIYCRRLVKLPEQEVNAASWGRKLTLAEFLIGLSWALLVGLLWQPAVLANHIYILALVVIIVSVRTMLATHSLPIVYAGTLPLVLTLAIMFAAHNNMLHWSLAGVIVATGLFYIILAHKVHDTARSMIVFRAQKDALIAELEEAKAKSDEARRHAEDANLAKSRFLATMSHELRTPLNAIMGFADVMRSEMLGKHQVSVYKEYSRDIHESGEHLLKLINEILDLSRIEAGRYTLDEEVISISDTGAECLRLMQLRAKKRGVELLRQFAPDLPLIRADEKAVRQIWLNLLSNAVKFTPTGGRVLASTRREHDGGISLVVRDTGPGIPPDEVEQVLSPFGQGAIARQRAEDGAGLGLPIVKGLAELHGARMSIRSKMRLGTEVSVTFGPERVVMESRETDRHGDVDPAPRKIA